MFYLVQFIIAHEGLVGKGKTVIGLYLGEVGQLSHSYNMDFVCKR